MSKENIHSIRKQYVHIELNGTESDGLYLRRRFPDLAYSLIMPAIESVFDRVGPQEEQICIEQLEIDAGVLSLENLEEELAASVAQSLEKELLRFVPSGTTSSGIISGNLQQKSSWQMVNEAFIYFLKTGSLPWSFKVPSDSSFENLIISSWQDSEKAGINPLPESKELLGVINVDIARKRLIRQFSPVFLEALLSILSPDGRKVADTVLQKIAPAEIPSVFKEQLIRQIWETIFAEVAVGRSLIPAKLVSRSLKTMPETVEVKVEMAELVKNIWPDITTEQLLITDKIQQDKIKESPLQHEADKDLDISGENQEAGEVISPEAVSTSPDVKETQDVHTDIVYTKTVDRDKDSLVQSLEKHDKSSINADESKQTEHDISSDVVPESLDIKRPADGHSKITHSDAKEQLKQDEISISRSTVKPDARPADEHKSQEASEETSPEFTRELIDSKKERIVESIHPDAKEGIYIQNAGLVLLHPFLPQFFNALGIASGDKVIQWERALCLLHFLATGQETVPEYELVLPKLLCGVSLTEAADTIIEISNHEKEEAMALLEAVISHWDVLRNTSPDGFRGTYLLRFGKLSQKADGDWQLQVEPKSWDMLLNQLPWGISIVRLPWMKHMLWVEWEQGI